MSCSKYRGQMFAAVEGTLSIESTLALEDHARGCASCAADLLRARRLDEALAQMTQPPVERVDVERNVGAIRAAIQAKARSSDRTSTVGGSKTRRWIAAAAVIVAAFAWWFARGRSSSIPQREPPLVGLLQRGEQVGSPATSHGGAAEATPDTAHSAPETAGATMQAGAGQDESTAVAAEEPTTTEEIEPSSIDFARLADARARVRSALIDASAERESSAALSAEPSPALEAASATDIDAMLARFDARTSDLAREGWPMARLVERVIADEDPVASTAAARWLGRRGDALSARKLAQQLSDPARKQVAAAALVDLDAKGRDALIGALSDDDLRDFIVDAAARKDPSAAAAMVVKAARSTSRGLDVRTAAESIARARLFDGEPWLEETVRERIARNDFDTASIAADALAKLGDAGALRSLLRLRDATHAQVDVLEPALTAMLTESGSVVASVARDLVAAKRGRELHTLYDVMMSAPSPSIVPALIVAASSRELGAAERRFAILLAGEQGGAADVAKLVELFHGLERSERDLKAATLVAIHRLGGRRAASDALDDVTPRTRERALAVLDRADASTRPETTLLQIAKELEPLLAPLQL